MKFFDDNTSATIDISGNPPVMYSQAPGGGGAGNSWDWVGGLFTSGLSGLFGGIGTLFSGLFSGIFGGDFNLACLGNQAYDETTLNTRLFEMSQRWNSVNTNNLNDISEFLSWCSMWVSDCDVHYQYLKNPCSKQWNQNIKLMFQKVIAEILPLVVYTTGTATNNSGRGDYEYRTYIVSQVLGNIEIHPTNPNSGTGSSSSGNGGVYVPPVTGGTGTSTYNPNAPVGDPVNAYNGLMELYAGLPASEKLLLQRFSTSEGMALDDVIEGFFSGSIKIENGKVVWSASAGNQPQTDFSTLLIWGVVGFGIYKLILKK